MVAFTRIFPKEYDGGRVRFALTNIKRGHLNAEEGLSYPNFYLDYATSGSCTCIGSVFFDHSDEDIENNLAVLDVWFYPADGNIGLNSNSLRFLRDYLNYLEENYKEIKLLSLGKKKKTSSRKR